MAVVAVSMRTSAGTSSVIGLAPESCSTTATILSITASSKSFIISRICGVGVLAMVHAAMIGSLLANIAAALPTIRLANAAATPGIARREVVGEFVEFGQAS